MNNYEEIDAISPSETEESVVQRKKFPRLLSDDEMRQVATQFYNQRVALQEWQLNEYRKRHKRRHDKRR